jgi:hypothetical protein
MSPAFRCRRMRSRRAARMAYAVPSAVRVCAVCSPLLSLWRFAGSIAGTTKRSCLSGREGLPARGSAPAGSRGDAGPVAVGRGAHSRNSSRVPARIEAPRAGRVRNPRSARPRGAVVDLGRTKGGAGRGLSCPPGLAARRPIATAQESMSWDYNLCCQIGKQESHRTHRTEVPCRDEASFSMPLYWG